MFVGWGNRDVEEYIKEGREEGSWVFQEREAMEDNSGTDKGEVTRSVLLKLPLGF